MANALYPKFKENILNGNVAMQSDTLKLALVDSTYTYSDAHEFYSDISGLVSTPIELLNKSVTNGVFDADDVEFEALVGSQVYAYIIYQDTGVDITSILVAYIDTTSSLPFTPNGTTFAINWDEGDNKIFSI